MSLTTTLHPDIMYGCIYLCPLYYTEWHLGRYTLSILPLCLDTCRVQFLKTYSDTRQWNCTRIKGVTSVGSHAYCECSISRLGDSTGAKQVTSFPCVCSQVTASVCTFHGALLTTPARFTLLKVKQIPQNKLHPGSDYCLSIPEAGSRQLVCMLAIQDLHLGLLDDKRNCCLLQPF